MAAPSTGSLVEERRPAGANPSPPVFSSSDSDEPFFDAVDVTREEEDEADEVVGVSMSRVQSRMKARQTPAEEKNRVMERNGGYFESIPDVNVEAEGLYVPEITAEPEGTAGEVTGNELELDKDVSHGLHPKDSGSRSGFTRSILKNGLPLRPRAWSGDTISNIKLKKFIPDLGSLRSSLPFKSNSTHTRGRSESMKPSTSSKMMPEQNDASPESLHHWPDSNGPAEEPISELQPVTSRTAAKHSYSRRPSASVSGRPPMLRRSSSDHSLYLRASSTASSLDQAPLYEHVHTQVNSRFKAIKDSLQDSSSRLLSMPTLHLQDIRSDWGYKQFLQDASQRRANHQSDDPNLLRNANGERAPPPQPQPTRVNSALLNPALAEAVSDMTGDVVVMGGYRGSILRSAKPPQRQLWVPMKVGLNLRKVDLEVGLNPEDEERMEENIIPSGVLSHIGPVDICRRLLRRLQKSDNAVNGDLRVWDYGYDWRLSPHLLSKRLIKFLEGLPCNAPGVPKEKRGAYVIAHSLGGLIARHAVNQRPELFSGVLYAGVPRHCVNILGPLRNGDDVLLSSRVLTAQVNFTFRTSFALLPEDGHCFIDKQTKEEYRVDFFSAKTWDEYHLSPCINPQLPPSSLGKGLKDNIPLIGKRFLGKDLSNDELVDPCKSTSSNGLHRVPEHHEPSRNPTAPANLVSDSSHKPTAPIPTLDGVVGPSSTPRPPVKATTACTIPRGEAMAYLERTLAEVRQFKQELAFNPSHQSENRYPPFAVLFGKSVPTVYGARVSSREQIKHQDAYDDLAFAAGDGVCLASAAMLPPGYRIIKNGLVKSERGHVGLLGDLDGVGQCLKAMVWGRREGVGLGPAD
ncbi:hypothetical protein PHISCL_00325 [Aspergillus sclerotialis]|uniref:Phosphatidylcholine-sterol O-acyltransferase n=1 Tax=Aspergillus sclerotialis TaxID=2070753 RepID=A0A3A3ABE4_9EURO|nr:hypothetical protein PHISCL_00325 [Aspergillus sclerotialis]